MNAMLPTSLRTSNYVVACERWSEKDGCNCPIEIGKKFTFYCRENTICPKNTQIWTSKFCTFRVTTIFASLWQNTHFCVKLYFHEHGFRSGGSFLSCDVNYPRCLCLLVSCLDFSQLKLANLPQKQGWIKFGQEVLHRLKFGLETQNLYHPIWFVERYQADKIQGFDVYSAESIFEKCEVFAGYDPWLLMFFSVNGARTTYARKSAVPAQSQNVASMSPVDLETYRAQCPPNRTSKIPAWTVSCTKIPPG